jgi:hypothetical protein
MMGSLCRVLSPESPKLLAPRASESGRLAEIRPRLGKLHSYGQNFVTSSFDRRIIITRRSNAFAQFFVLNSHVSGVLGTVVL